MNKLFINLNDEKIQAINEDFEIIELQRNILNNELIENKIVISFESKTTFDDFFNKISKIEINKISVADNSGIILFERENITNNDISIFSYTKNEEEKIRFYMEINTFDQIERG